TSENDRDRKGTVQSSDDHQTKTRILPIHSYSKTDTRWLGIVFINLVNSIHLIIIRIIKIAP
ncbi:MAG: hypothetical protein ACK451_00825, partial [Pseudanabaena sp.]